MKKVYYFVLLFFLASCTSCKSTFYQLIELESNDIKKEDKILVSGNEDLDVIFNFWSNGGSSDLRIFNKTNKNIYVKHDECQFIVNGRAIDYYDNSEYTSSKSIEKRSSRTSSSSSSNSSSSSQTKSNIYGLNSINTGINALGSTSSKTSGNSSSSGFGVSYSSSQAFTSSSGVMRTAKRIFILAPNSSRVIEGYALQGIRFWDCDVSAKPTKKTSNRENGLSFDEANTPLKFRFRVCYSFDEDFIDKEFYEASAYVSQFSNWNPKAFYTTKKSKTCPSDKTRNSSKRTELYSPMRYYKAYTKAKR